jgi:hypothetical protein
VEGPSKHPKGVQHLGLWLCSCVLFMSMLGGFRVSFTHIPKSPPGPISITVTSVADYASPSLFQVPTDHHQMSATTSQKSRSSCQYKILFFVLAYQNLPLPVQNEKSYTDKQCVFVLTQNQISNILARHSVLASPSKKIICQYKMKNNILATNAFLYWHTTNFDTYWQDILYWQAHQFFSFAST